MTFKVRRPHSVVRISIFPSIEGEYDIALLRWTGAICAWLPFLFFLSCLPTELYLSNALNFEYRHGILYPYIGLTLVSLVALLSASRSRIIVIQKGLDGLFFLGLFAVASFVFIPLNWGELNGHDELRESLPWAIIQGLIFLLLTLLWLHVPSSSFRKPGAIFVAILFTSQLVSVFQIFGASSGSDALPTSQIEAAGQESSRPNIYHFVFDAYSGRSFPELADIVMPDGDLRDFTYFPRAMAHYPFTDLSVPSFLTGKTYKAGSLKEFQAEAKTGGLSEFLRQSGYQTASYTPNRTRFWSHNNASQIYATSDEFQGEVGKTFLLVSAVRAAPEFLRQEVHSMMSRYLWNGENAYSHYKRLSVPLVEKFLEDERIRGDQGHYVYVHLILPHGPYVRSGDCSIEEETSYLDQAECATRLMKRIVDTLKALGRYDNSIIVFHSDHGSVWEAEVGNPISTLPAEVETEYMRLGHYMSSDQFLGVLNALLLVKPAGDGTQDLKRSELLAQLVDIPATVADLAGLGSEFGDGSSLFSNYVEREVHVFLPTRSIKTIRQTSIFGGEEGTVGVFGHFAFSPADGWSAHPDIEILNEGWMGGVF